MLRLFLATVALLGHIAAEPAKANARDIDDRIFKAAWVDGRIWDTYGLQCSLLPTLILRYNEVSSGNASITLPNAIISDPKNRAKEKIRGFFHRNKLVLLNFQSFFGCDGKTSHHRVTGFLSNAFPFGVDGFRIAGKTGEAKNLKCWSISDIRNTPFVFYPDNMLFNTFPSWKNPDAYDLWSSDRDPRSVLRVADLSGVSGHPLGLAQSTPDKIYRTDAEGEAKQTGPHHNSGGTSYTFLGIQVAFGTLLILCGFYFLKDATTQGRRGKFDFASSLYPINGLLGIAAGGFFIAHALFG